MISSAEGAVISVATTLAFGIAGATVSRDRRRSFAWGELVVTAASGAGAAALGGLTDPVLGVAAGLGAWIAVTVAIGDLRRGLIADVHSGLIAVTGLAAAPFLHDVSPYMVSIGGGVLTFGLLAAVAAAYRMARGVSGLGGGDIGLGGALGIWVGFGLVGPALLIACAATFALAAATGRGGGDRVVFAPGLCAGFGAVAFAQVLLKQGAAG